MQTNGPHSGEGTVTAPEQSLFRLQRTMASVSLINFTWHLKDMWIQKKLFFNHIPWRPKKFGSIVLRAGTIFSCVGDVWCCCTTNSRAEIWLMTKALNTVKQKKKLIMSALQTNLCVHSISVHSCHRASEALLYYSKHRLKHLSGIKARSTLRKKRTSSTVN